VVVEEEDLEGEELHQRSEVEEVDCCYLLSSVDSLVLVPQVELLEWLFGLVSRLVLP